LILITAKAKLKKSTKYTQDNRLSKREFRTFVQAVTDEVSGADSFDYYIDFLTNSVEVSRPFNKGQYQVLLTLKLFKV
jgi:hypothetical protein